MQKFFTRKFLLIAVVGLFHLLLYTQSFAQPPAGQPAPPSQQTVSEGELQSFAKAYVEVEEIRTSHEAALSQTQEPEQAAKIQQEANGKMVQALEKQGLTPESYMRIFNTVNSDSALAKRALDLIAKERAS